ncbi:hypothetical protein DPMN_063472 [Dreissena polymorpha]|uniref:Uncharacterized protein n=1 Tax=Dreissena polymorpha TaxID=45954 RepID=A0A9D4HJ51_DREPO|nr:hypothetical protein DPMN_063472 [Dreissena polymorpha]
MQSKDIQTTICFADDTKLGHEVKVRWMVTGDNSSYHDTLMMRDALEILARPKYTFNHVGMYTVGKLSKNFA